MTPEQYRAELNRSRSRLLRLAILIFRALAGKPPTRAQLGSISRTLLPEILKARRDAVGAAERFYAAHHPDGVAPEMPVPHYDERAVRLLVDRTLGKRAGDDAQEYVARIVENEFVAGVARHADMAARDALAEAARQDEKAAGWARVVQGERTCAFCWMTASRGPVYSSRGAAGGDARRKFHDGCDCLIVPVFDENDWPGRDAHLEAARLWRDHPDLNDLRRHLESDRESAPSAGGPAAGQSLQERRDALGIDYGHDAREIRLPEVETAERLLAAGAGLEHVPTDHDESSSTSDYLWTPKGATTAHLIEVKSLEIDTRLHPATFPMRIKKAVGKSIQHGAGKRKRKFLVDAGDRDVGTEVVDALRSFNRDNPGHEIERLWLVSKGTVREIDLT